MSVANNKQVVLCRDHLVIRSATSAKDTEPLDNQRYLRSGKQIARDRVCNKRKNIIKRDCNEAESEEVRKKVERTTARHGCGGGGGSRGDGGGGDSEVKLQGKPDVVDKTLEWK